VIRQVRDTGSPTSPGAGAAAIASVESIELGAPLVPATGDGARALGEWYWDELRRTSRGLVQAREDDAGVRLVLGGAATLFRFGPPELVVDDADVVCRYPILGGALASSPGGALSIVQRGGDGPRLEVVVTEYRSRLAERGARFHRGLLYTALQAPLHRRVSRGFLRRTARRPT
jgi:hypothetical protein